MYVCILGVCYRCLKNLKQSVYDPFTLISRCVSVSININMFISIEMKIWHEPVPPATAFTV